MRVSVVIPARNAAATLPGTLDALARQDFGEPYEVIVVDNGSTDGTPDVAERAGERVRVIRQENLGPAVGRNNGVAAARAGLLAFTDADCEPEPGWLAAGVGELERYDLVQGPVRPFPDRPLSLFDRTLWVERENGLYETANLFVRRGLFERLGGFETVRSPSERPFGEDTVFGWRARRSGARSRFCPEAVVHHAVFRGAPREYVAERLRSRYFPELTARVPELRDTLYYRRYFLNSRTAAFDVALAAAALALVSRSPLPLLAGGPYGATIVRKARRWRYGPRAAAVEVLADAVRFGALAYGSLRHRRALL